MFAGYIYKITIPTSNGLRFYYGRRISNKIDINYWGSGKKLKHWIYKHTNGKVKHPSSMSVKTAEKLGLKREILCYASTVEEAYELEYQIVKLHLGEKDCWNLIDGGKCSATYGNKGHKQSEEVKEYLRKINKGKVISRETREKMSKSHLGKRSPKGMLGKTHSEETRKKLSQLKSGTKLSEETKRKIGDANRNPSPETRAKMSAFMKRRKPIIHKEETKKILSEKKLGKLNPAFGKKWWNNGETCLLASECPGENFIQGRLKGLKNNSSK